jgi:hypothetical protein
MTCSYFDQRDSKSNPRAGNKTSNDPIGMDSTIVQVKYTREIFTTLHSTDALGIPFLLMSSEGPGSGH